MKRLFSILLNTLATFMLLVSVITPHHHHGDIVCISTSCSIHETTNDAGHECEGDFTDCCPHHHDNDDESASDDDCIAKATYLVSNQNEIKSKFRSYDEHNHNIHFTPVFLLLTSCYDTDAGLVYLTKHRYRERNVFRESGNVNRLNGLRAPPYSIA